ncbi:hypothetical protein DFH09DRAFT_1448040 [Mycena vulgaris]|nr:hypothetical protein DFH09DRAFT_1448040 [Mycena vulgaris]
MIGRLSDQWQNIAFSVFPHHIHYLFRSQGQFSQLKKLTIECSSYFTFKEHYPEFRCHGCRFPGYPPRTLKDAFSLREIQLYRAPWPSLTVPWGSLSVFQSEKMNVSQCIDVLRNATSLSSCTLSLVRDIRMAPITSLPPITNLHDLTLSERADTRAPLVLMDLLRHLTLPSRKNLTLRFEGAEDRPPADITEFIFFASRSYRH